MGYSYLADLIVAVHVVYVSFVVLGQLAIFWGLVRNKQWVRNPWFRWSHLLAILIVALEAVSGIACPLTVWEDRLRSLAGEEVNEGTFIGRALHDLIFFDFSPWVFTVIYVGFALLVLATFVLAPPRWNKFRSR